MAKKRDGPDSRCSGKKYQIPVIEREVTFTLDDGTKIKRYIRSLDSAPIHNYGSSLFCMGNSISLLSAEEDYMRGMLNVERP